jgi:hypothetical protein
MTTSGSILAEFWNDQLVEHERQGVFLVLVGFLVSFGFIRLSARLGRSPRVPWWPGSVVTDSGLHLHHLVWGICLMLASGALGFALFDSSPWFEVSAVCFGIGAGLTIDEFALWIHLEDVYWAREGRSSIDAAFIAGAAMLLILLGAVPLEVNTGSVAGDIVVAVFGAVILLLPVAVCFAKERVLHCALGIFFTPLAVYAALRIGKPRSPWAKRFYGDRNPEKQAKAEERFRADRRTERFKERFRDAVGGETQAAYEARLAQQAATGTASSELRERSERARSAPTHATPADEAD